MILPIGDAPNPRNFTPWVTWLLIAANVLVYLLFTLRMGFTPVNLEDPALRDYIGFLRTVLPPEQLQLAVEQTSQWDLAVWEYGYRPANPEFMDVLTSMFMHAGIAHLGGNMLFLWIYGDNVECRMGRVAYLLSYVGMGIAATLSFAWLAGPSNTPLVGASGAISGVLGAYFVAFPRNVVKLLVGIPPFFFNVFMLPAWVVLAAYVLLNNLLPLLSGASSNVAYGAHLGGFVAGVAVMLPVVWGGALLGPAPEAREPRGVEEEARRLEREGKVNQAFQRLVRASQRAEGREKAELQLAAGRMLARYDRRPEAYQWLYRAMQHPSTREAAADEMRSMGLDPRLMDRVTRR